MINTHCSRLGLTASLAIHLAFVLLSFYLWQHQPEKEKLQTVAVKLAMFEAPAAKPAPAPAKPTPPKPEPKTKPKPQPKAQPKPKPTPRPTPKPVEKPIAKPEVTPVVEKQTQPVEQQPEPAEQPEAQQADIEQQAMIASLEQQYMAELIMAIEQRKYYSRRAQRLRHEGKVVISFTVLADGTISNIRVQDSSGKSTLDSSGMKTLEKLAHFKPIPDELERTSWDFSIPIIYSLR